MKYIDDYTKEEILNLTDEDIERVIKIGLANAGLKLPKRPEEPNYNEIPEGDVILFKVTRAHQYFSSLPFLIIKSVVIVITSFVSQS
jgi:hypothetical protein